MFREIPERQPEQANMNLFKKTAERTVTP